MRKSKGIALLLACMLCVMPAVQAVAAGASGADTNEWTITLDYADGVSRNGTLFVEKATSVTLPTTPVRKGYSFVGWKTESGETVDAAYQPQGDVTLVAEWTIGQCSVTFADGVTGETLSQASYEYGSALTDLPTPEKAGFAFRYWSLSAEGERVDFSTYTLKGDVTFYAVWMEETSSEYHIVFMASDFAGSEKKELFVEDGGKVNKKDAVTDLEHEGYEFEGWSALAPREGSDWIITTYPAKNDLPDMVKLPFKPKEDTNLYAVWSIQQFMAIFNANYTDSEYKNGVVYSYNLLSSEAAAAPEQEPVRAGYTFEGWYTKAVGGEQVDFASGIKLKANTGFYAHWKNDGVTTDTFHAEYTPFDPDQKYYGYSGSVQGANCIVKDAGTVGTVAKDEYPTNSKLAGGNAYYVSYQYERGDTLRFVITASKATTAKLSANLAVEVDSMQVASTGENATAIRVNGQDITYSLTVLRIFQEYEIATIELNEGENVIEFVVDNDNTIMGGTYRAVGFMTDYIKLTDSDATFTWSPIYDNLENN